MYRLLDKLIIFAFCFAFYIQSADSAYIVVPVIAAVTLSSLCSFFDKYRVNILVYSVYIILCFADPGFMPFLPLICYDILLIKPDWLLAAAVLPLLSKLSEASLFNSILNVSIIGVTFLVKLRTTSLEKLRHEYTSLRDSAKEFSLQLEAKNKELLEKQDYEANLATMNERNRIAHEIHDTVGHLLSSSILQIGALMTISKDSVTREGLGMLKATLAKGMDSIRSSIHDLHDESIDLYTEISKLVKDFHFCSVTFDYDMQSNPDKKLKYSFISIIKESLANVIRHSDATNVEIMLHEHPAIYQLVIKDNGTALKVRMDHEDGIGIRNMTERITGLGGIININNDKGFKIFISVPKQQTGIMGEIR